MNRHDVTTLVFFILLLIVSGFAAYKLGTREHVKPSVSYQQQEVSVSVDEVIPTAKKINYANQGRVVSGNNIDIVSEVSGTVLSSKLNLRKGESFKNGQLLYLIDNQIALNKARTLKSDFIQTFANFLVDAHSDFPKKHERWKTFFHSIDINEPLPPLPKDISDQEKTFLASRGIYNQYYTIKNQEYLLAKHYITAPFDGVIEEVYFKVGSSVNQGNKLLNISQRNSSEIEVPVPIDLSEHILIGSNVFINDEISGKVIRKNTKIDAPTQSIMTYILPETTLKLGEFVRVVFKDIIFDNLIVVPQSALHDGQSFFYMKNDSIIQSQKATIVHKEGDKIYLSGVEKNLKIIQKSSSRLSDGQKVVIENPMD